MKYNNLEIIKQSNNFADIMKLSYWIVDFSRHIFHFNQESKNQNIDKCLSQTSFEFSHFT